MERKKINIVTLGCSKNLVDSEHLAGRCEAAGYDIVFDSNSPDARIVVVNTCGFIGDAKEESIETILGFAAAREAGEIDRLYVIGCLSERWADELRAEIPEVDEFFGARGIEEIFEELLEEKNEGITRDVLQNSERSVSTARTLFNSRPAVWNAESNGSATHPSAIMSDERSDERNEANACFSRKIARKLSTPDHYAYLKISEGCDRRCGFCAIPLIRGPHVSVPMERLVAEAEHLAAAGVKELIVIAQDTTYYGLDIYGERRLAELLQRLARIEGIEWIRLHYAYPAGFPEDVIEVMRTEPKICKYLDIPLQHISGGQLRDMKRGLDGRGTRELVEKLRAAIPGLAIRTTLLVGYPGESETDFEELLEFVREARFERLGVFPYSEEEGTYSAEKLTDDVPPEVKERRVERIMELQAQISAELNAQRVGSIRKVIVDRREGEHWVCRSEFDSPEVDGEVLVKVSDMPAKNAQNIQPGEIITVRITAADEYDLVAEKL